MSGSDHSVPDVKAPATERDTLLKDSSEVLLRQIHPNLYVNGIIASTAFAPTANDKGELSVDRSSLVTPDASFELYMANGRESVAVYGVSVGQFEAQAILCHSDPLPEADGLRANPAHAYADFGGIESSKKQKQTAQKLRDQAVKRGCLYTP